MEGSSALFLDRALWVPWALDLSTLLAKPLESTNRNALLNIITNLYYAPSIHRPLQDIAIQEITKHRTSASHPALQQVEGIEVSRVGALLSPLHVLILLVEVPSVIRRVVALGKTAIEILIGVPETLSNVAGISLIPALLLLDLPPSGLLRRLWRLVHTHLVPSVVGSLSILIKDCLADVLEWVRVGLIISILSSIAAVPELEAFWTFHLHRFDNSRLVHMYTVDLAVVLIELWEFDGVGVVFVDELKTQPDFVVADLDGGAAQLFHQQGELFQSQTSFLLIEVVEHLLQTQSVTGDKLIQLSKATLDLGAYLR